MLIRRKLELLGWFRCFYRHCLPLLNVVQIRAIECLPSKYLEHFFLIATSDVAPVALWHAVFFSHVQDLVGRMIFQLPCVSWEGDFGDNFLAGLFRQQ